MPGSQPPISGDHRHKITIIIRLSIISPEWSEDYHLPCPVPSRPYQAIQLRFPGSGCNISRCRSSGSTPVTLEIYFGYIIWCSNTWLYLLQSRTAKRRERRPRLPQMTPAIMPRCSSRFNKMILSSDLEGWKCFISSQPGCEGLYLCFLLS